MGLSELFLLSVSLSMDAFAVSVCKGLSVDKLKPAHILLCGFWFGLFQALMPFIGYSAGLIFYEYIHSYDKYIAFSLLFFIGAKMLWDTFKNDSDQVDVSFSFYSMLLLAVATSIDALAVGFTFSVLPDINIVLALCLIGIVTFLLSAAGVKLGNLFGSVYKTKAQFAGGFILILLAFKMLLFP
ncbi:MAG: manganese efflux pump MntP family protein [Clostridia bacterium]|nr:manganese efflux pump MntP family protein [Clostridia bacterium]